MTDFRIHPVRPEDLPAWLEMRLALWPDAEPEEHRAEMDEILTDPDTPVFIASLPDGRPCGFVEGGIRKYADGCESSPVGYVEGWYVDAAFRRQGLGGLLLRAIEDWTRARGLSEVASDTWLDNQISISAHQKAGYVETERLVHFVKKL